MDPSRSRADMPGLPANDFASAGAHLFRGVLKPHLSAIEEALQHLPTDKAGVRINGVQALTPLLAPGGCIGSVAASVLGVSTRPVRAILFDKTKDTNWSLAWHQDRTICVTERQEGPGFGPWTIKAGMQHVAPPYDLLARMVTLRAHLDDVPADNAPLLIAPSSHALGAIPEGEVDEVVERCGTVVCTAEAGDVWLYATPTLHASEVAARPTRRRVLQVDYAAEDLPYGLQWLGV